MNVIGCNSTTNSRVHLQFGAREDATVIAELPADAPGAAARGRRAPEEAHQDGNDNTTGGGGGPRRTRQLPRVHVPRATGQHKHKRKRNKQ